MLDKHRIEYVESASRPKEPDRTITRRFRGKTKGKLQQTVPQEKDVAVSEGRQMLTRTTSPAVGENFNPKTSYWGTTNLL